MAGARRWALDLGDDSDSGTWLRRTATRRAGEGPTAEARGARATSRKTGGSAQCGTTGLWRLRTAVRRAPVWRLQTLAAPSCGGAVLSTCRRLVGLGA
jgi:hypothetical protein